jgi:hypothetical protein
MKTPFEQLYAFLKKLSGEVEGHEYQAPTPDLAAQLDRLASGTCNEEERERICALIRKSPGSIKYLADRAKQK